MVSPVPAETITSPDKNTSGPNYLFECIKKLIVNQQTLFAKIEEQDRTLRQLLLQNSALMQKFGQVTATEQPQPIQVHKDTQTVTPTVKQTICLPTEVTPRTIQSRVSPLPTEIKVLQTSRKTHIETEEGIPIPRKQPRSSFGAVNRNGKRRLGTWAHVHYDGKGRGLRFFERKLHRQKRWRDKLLKTVNRTLPQKEWVREMLERPDFEMQYEAADVMFAVLPLWLFDGPEIVTSGKLFSQKFLDEWSAKNTMSQRLTLCVSEDPIVLYLTLGDRMCCGSQIWTAMKPLSKVADRSSAYGGPNDAVKSSKAIFSLFTDDEGCCSVLREELQPFPGRSLREWLPEDCFLFRIENLEPTAGVQENPTATEQLTTAA